MTRHSTTDSFTKGGQIFTHRLRMLKQNVMVLCRVFLGSYLILFFSLWAFFQLRVDHLKLLGTYLFAHLKLFTWPGIRYLLQSLDQTLFALQGNSVISVAYKSAKVLRSEVFVFGRKIHLPSYVFVKHKAVLMHLEQIYAIHFYSLCLGLSLTFLMLIKFRSISKKIEGKRLLKGNQLISGKKLKGLLSKKKLKSFFKIGDSCLQKYTESQHMLIIGATGSGKSNALHQLIPQIRKKKNRAIIIDQKGDMVSKHYDPDRDILINPFDKRSKGWHLWAEGSDDISLDILASYLFPVENVRADPFWEKGAQLLFKYTAKYLSMKQNYNMEKLADYMASKPPKAVVEFLKKNGGESFTDQSVEKTYLNVKMMMALVADKIRYFKNENKDIFSFKEWIHEDKEDGQFVFITVGPNQKETLLPFLQFWISWSMAQVEGLKEVNPKKPDPRLWFLLDELPALRKVHQLEHSLAFMRSYGACVVAGLQNIYQLQEIYGYSNARSMLTNFSTKLCFRLGDDPDTRTYVSNFFGEKQSIETNENFSIGSHQMRDGVNIQSHKHKEAVIDRHDLNQLEQTSKHIEGILKVPGNFPPAKIKVPYQNLKRTQERFIEKGSF